MKIKTRAKLIKISFYGAMKKKGRGREGVRGRQGTK